MSHYDNCSRGELIGRIEELEARLASAADTAGRFRDRYACKILDSIPDMLTVLRRDGTLVELVSSEQTNHVGIEGPMPSWTPTEATTASHLNRRRSMSEQPGSASQGGAGTA